VSMLTDGPQSTPTRVAGVLCSTNLRSAASMEGGLKEAISKLQFRMVAGSVRNV